MVSEVLGLVSCDPISSIMPFLRIGTIAGEETSWTEYSMSGSLMAWQTALHEYLGMFVYGVTR